MKLGELKKSLSKFPSDMDDSEVLISFMSNEKEDYDDLAFVSYTVLPNDIMDTCIVLGGVNVAIFKIKNRTIKYADGTIPPFPDDTTDNPSDEGFDVNG